MFANMKPKDRLDFHPYEATELAEMIFNDSRYFDLLDNFFTGKLTVEEFLQKQLFLIEAKYERMLELKDEHEKGV